MVRNFKVNKYIENVFKSTASSAGTMFTERYMPQTSAIIKDISRQATEARDIINQSRLSNSTGSRAMETGVMKNVSDGFKNILEDLKTGNFNNTERADKAAAEAFGFNFDFENDLGNADDIFGAEGDDIFSPEANISMDAKLTNNTIAKSSSIMTSTLANAIATTGREVARAEMGYDKKKSILNMNFLTSHFNQVHGNLGAINSNLSTVVSFNNDVMKPYAARAMQFFDDMTNNTKDVLGLTRENIEMQRNLYSDFLSKKQQEGRGQSRYSKVFNASGGIDFMELFTAVQSNSSNSGLGMFSDMLGGDMGQMMVGNPLGMILSSMILPQLVNSKIGKSAFKMDKAIGAFGRAGNSKLGTFKNSSNPILSFLADMFHIKPELKSGVDTSNYVKGAIPFDGETKKAVMNTADTLLRIETLLSGGKARTFNYKTGKYQSLEDSEKQFKEEFDEKIIRSMGGTRDKMKSMVNASNLKNKDSISEEFDVIFKNLITSDFFFNPNTKYSDLPFSDKISRTGFDGFKKAFMSMRNEDRIKFQSDIATSRDSNSNLMNDIEKNLDSYGYSALFNNSNSNTKSIFSSINDTTNKILLQIRDVLVRGINVGNVANIDHSDIFSDQSDSTINPVRRHIKPVGIRRGVGTNYNNGRGIRLDSRAVYESEDWQHERNNYIANNGVMNRIGSGVEKISDFGIQKMHDVIYGKNAMAKASGTYKDDEDNNPLGDPNSWKAKMQDSMSRGGAWMKEQLSYEKMKENLPKFKMAGKMSLGSMLAGLAFGNPLVGLIGSMGSFVMASDTAKNFMFGKLGEDGERKGGAIPKNIQDIFKNSFSKMSLGALGSFGLSSALFGSFGLAAPVIGASLGMALSFDRVKRTMFGDIDTETGESKGGVFNTKFIDFIKTHGKGIFAGLLGGGAFGQLLAPSLGLFGGLAPIMLGSMGAGLSFSISSGKASKWLFGEKDENGKDISKGIINEKMIGLFKKFAPKGLGGMFTGGLLSSLFTSFGPTGIILSSLFSSAVGIGLETDKFKNWFFGDKDDSTGKREGGIKGKMSDWFENNITSFFMGTKGKYGTRYSDGLFSGITEWFYGGYNPVTKTRENGVASKMSTWFESNITSFFFGTKDADNKREGGLFNDVKLNMKNWWIDSIKNPFKEALTPLKSIFKEMQANMSELFKTGWDTVTATINNVFEQSVGKPLGELITEKVTNPLKNMITKIVMGVGKVLGSIISAPIKGLNFFAKSVLGNKEGDKVSNEQKDLDETIESMDDQAKRNKKGFDFSFNFNKIGEMVRDGFNGMNIFSKFGSIFNKGKSKTKTDSNKYFDIFNIFGSKDGVESNVDDNSTSSTNASDVKSNNISTLFNTALSYLKQHMTDKSVLTRMKNETASAYRRRIVNLYKKYKMTDSNTSNVAATESGDNDTDESELDSSDGSFLNRFKRSFGGIFSKFKMNKTKSTATERIVEGLDKMSEFADSAMKDSKEKKKKSKSSLGSMFRFRGIKSLTFDPTPTELKQGTVDMFHEYIPQMTSNIFEIKKEVHGQLDGVGYNLETITNILRTHIGQPDKNAKEYNGRGNKKHRGVFGMLRELVMKPIDFIGGIAAKLNPFTIMSKLFGLPIKGVQALFEGFKNIFKLPEMIVGGLKGLGSGIALSLKLAIGSVGNILDQSVKILGTTLTTGIDAMGSILNTGFNTLDTSISVLGNVVGNGIQALGPMLSLAVNGGLEGMKLLGKGGKYIVENGAKGINYMLNAGMTLFGKGVDILKDFNPLLHHTFKVKVEGGKLDNVDVVNLVKAVGSVGKDAMDNSGAKVTHDQKFKNIQEAAEGDDNREREQQGVLKKISDYIGLKAKMDMAGGILSMLTNGIKGLGETISTIAGGGGLATLAKTVLGAKVAGTAGKAVGSVKGAVGGIGSFFKGIVGGGAKGTAGAMGNMLGPAMIFKHLWGGEYSDAASDTVRYAMKNDKISTNILLKIFQHPSILKLIGGDKTLKALTPLFMKLGKQYGSKISKNIAKKAAMKSGRAVADTIAAGTAVAGVGVVLKLGIISYDLISGMSSANRLFMIPNNESPSVAMRVSAGIYKVLTNLIWGLDGIMDSEGSRAWLLDVIYNTMASEIEKAKMNELDTKMKEDYDKYKQDTGEEISFDEYNNKMNKGIIGKGLDATKGAWKAYKGVWSKAYDGVKNFDLAETIGKGANKAKWLYMDTKEYFNNMGVAIKSGFSNAYDKVIEWWNGPSFIDRLKDGISSGFTTAVKGTKEAIMTIPDKLENVWSAITSLPEKLVEFLKGLDPREYVKDKYNNVKNRVGDFFGNFKDKVKESYDKEEAKQREDRGLQVDDYLTSNFTYKSAFSTQSAYNKIDPIVPTGLGRFASFKKPIFGMGDTKFVSQLDSKYANIDMTVPGDSNKVSFKDVGCAPASMAMVLETLGKKSDPKELAQIAVTGGYKLADDGTHIKYFKDLGEKNGVPTVVVYTNKDSEREKVLTAAKSGLPIILLGTDKASNSNTPFSETPHYVMVKSYDGTKFTIYDPLQKEPKLYYATDVLNKTTMAVIFGDVTAKTEGIGKTGILGLLDKLSGYFEKLVGEFTGSSSDPSIPSNNLDSGGLDVSNIDFSKIPTNSIKFTSDPVKNKNAQYAASIIVPKAKAAGIDPTLAMAQWAWESNWGTKAPGNAFFGIKASGRSKGSRKTMTHEYVNGVKVSSAESFATYKDLADSTDGYLDLINRRYAAVKTHGAKGLLKEYNGYGSYATDPKYITHINTMQSQLRKAFNSASISGFTGMGKLKSLSIDPNKILNKFGASDNSISKVVDTINGNIKPLKHLDTIVDTPDKLIKGMTSKVNASVQNVNRIGDQLTRLPETTLNRVHSEATNKINSAVNNVSEIPNNAIKKIESDVINKTINSIGSSVTDMVAKPISQIENIVSSVNLPNAIGQVGGTLSSPDIVAKLDVMISLLQQLVANTSGLKMSDTDNKAAKIKSAMGVPVDNSTSHSLDTDRMVNMLVKRRYT